jgi:hypothetical protein
MSSFERYVLHRRMHVREAASIEAVISKFSPALSKGAALRTSTSLNLPGEELPVSSCIFPA